MSQRDGFVLAVIVIFAVVILLIRGDSSKTAGSDSTVKRLAQAIAQAEGFFVAGSRPRLDHNPGDLTVDVTGKGIGFDGIIVKYATDADGWEALYQQVGKMLNNTSRIYNRDMTLLEVSRFWTTTQVTEWAANVSNSLGVPVSTRLRDI